MSQNKDIKALLEKFALSQCNDDEIERLIGYFKNTDSLVDFPEVEDLIGKMDAFEKMDANSGNEIFQKIMDYNKEGYRELKSNGNRKISFLKYSAVAAIFFGVMAISYINRSSFTFNKSENASVAIDTFNINEQKVEVVTLQLENGNIEVISEDGTSEVLDEKGNIVGKQKGNQIVYNGKATTKDLEYNTLVVPFGKNFELLLSDGTTVHLNAGTSLKYPVQFLTGMERQVFLMGEAFFDVSKDPEHPFIINSGDLNIRVLGTKFNVTAYGEDEVTEVVLVEGSVGLYNEIKQFDKDSFLLKPGQKGSYDKKQKDIASEEVITGLYTSWMKGELVFRNMTFDNILKKMERNYNVSIINNNIKIRDDKFNASFRNAPIAKVMEYFKTAYDLDYTINGREITIH
tara:strand:- start:6223 stop:7428 length:1206 start_codon:yes stop_codon:yes gene_type:complete